MQLVLASGNTKKLHELKTILTPLQWRIHSQAEFNVPEAEETGLSFIENAIIKARHAAQHTQLPALADDSGLCVNALHGAPGVYSARFSGAAATDASNNALLLEKLAGVCEKQRKAFFFCALAFVQHALDPTPLIVSTRWYGSILQRPQGTDGFGYDPLFFVSDQQCSAAQLNSTVKNTISHRGQAMQKLLTALQHHLSSN